MHIGYLSFRIAGTDGVSLEAERWKIMLERMGHEVTMIAGELDRQGLLVPDISFTEPQIYDIHEQAIYHHAEFSKLKPTINKLAKKIKKELEEIFQKFEFDHLIVANVLSLPFHFALTVALERIIKQYKIPVTSRNHDFWWERERYLKPSWIPFFEQHFPPPVNPLIKHVVINSIAQKELKKRTGLESLVIGDSFDFTNNSDQPDCYSKHWRKDFKIKPDDIIFLQATRIVPRKKIELAVELVKRLNHPRSILVIASYAGDEGLEYQAYLKYLIKRAQIRALFIDERVGPRREIKKGKRIYTLWDCFANCDFVTYPSEFEGFGNQFIEAANFKKPIFVNRYEVYKADLEPLGFKTAAIDGQVTDKAVAEVEKILNNPKLRKQIVDTNYRIAKQHFSFEATQKKLAQLGF